MRSVPLARSLQIGSGGACNGDDERKSATHAALEVKRPSRRTFQSKYNRMRPSEIAGVLEELVIEREAEHEQRQPRVSKAGRVRASRSHARFPE